jgi:hypothetical protein
MTTTCFIQFSQIKHARGQFCRNGKIHAKLVRFSEQNNFFVYSLKPTSEFCHSVNELLHMQMNIFDQIKKLGNELAYQLPN